LRIYSSESVRCRRVSGDPGRDVSLSVEKRKIMVWSWSKDLSDHVRSAFAEQGVEALKNHGLRSFGYTLGTYGTPLARSISSYILT
jgi:hypothetical protein